MGLRRLDRHRPGASLVVDLCTSRWAYSERHWLLVRTSASGSGFTTVTRENAVRKSSCLIVAAALGITGCASGPTGSAGSGFGREYTPVMDMNGVDQSRYSADLQECRRYADSISVGDSAAGGAAASALFGAILAGALGGRRSDALAVARAGLVTGGAQGAVAAGNKQQNILLNCLVGRGYRPLEVTLAYSPPPKPQQPVAAMSVATTPALQVAVQAPPPPVATSSAPVQMARTSTLQSIGIHSHTVERLPDVLACNAQPAPRLTASQGNSLETYTVACTGGDVLSVRCEWGNCRALK